jgi:hypothetical protein
MCLTNTIKNLQTMDVLFCFTSRLLIHEFEFHGIGNNILKRFPGSNFFFIVLFKLVQMIRLWNYLKSSRQTHVYLEMGIKLFMTEFY